jgi:heat shock protein HspQ
MDSASESLARGTSIDEPDDISDVSHEEEKPEEIPIIGLEEEKETYYKLVCENKDIAKIASITSTSITTNKKVSHH